MNPDKEWDFLVQFQPRQRMRYDLTAAPFDRLIAVFSSAPPVKAGIIGVKPTIEPGGGQRGTGKGFRLIPIPSKDVGSVGQVPHQGYAEIVDLVELRIGAGEDGGVGRRRQRHL